MSLICRVCLVLLFPLPIFLLFSFLIHVYHSLSIYRPPFTPSSSRPLITSCCLFRIPFHSEKVLPYIYYRFFFFIACCLSVHPLCYCLPHYVVWEHSGSFCSWFFFSLAEESSIYMPSLPLPLLPPPPPAKVAIHVNR